MIVLRELRQLVAHRAERIAHAPTDHIGPTGVSGRKKRHFSALDNGFPSGKDFATSTAGKRWTSPTCNTAAPISPAQPADN